VSTNNEVRGTTAAARRRGRQAQKRKSPLPTSASHEGSESNAKCKSRKRSPNWEVAEITTLIEAKELDHMRTMDVTDNRDHIEKADTRWASISQYVMKKTHSDKGACLFRDKDACRDKWQSIYGDYKHIFDYLKGIGINLRYKDMTPDDRAQAGLPRHFSLHHYRLIDSFCKDRPNVHPPHARDSSDPLNNNNYVPNQSIENDINMDDDFQDPINLHSLANLVAGTSAFTGDDPEDTDFADLPPRPVAAEASQRGADCVTPEDLFKQSVSRRGLWSGNT
jgi:hypothetical protein